MYPNRLISIPDKGTIRSDKRQGNELKTGVAKQAAGASQQAEKSKMRQKGTRRAAGGRPLPKLGESENSSHRFLASRGSFDGSTALLSIPVKLPAIGSLETEPRKFVKQFIWRVERAQVFSKRPEHTPHLLQIHQFILIGAKIGVNTLTRQKEKDRSGKREGTPQRVLPAKGNQQP